MICIPCTGGPNPKSYPKPKSFGNPQFGHPAADEPMQAYKTHKLRPNRRAQKAVVALKQPLKVKDLGSRVQA